MQSLERRFESTSVKAVLITILTVLMLWPLSRVESLISERQNLQHEAYAVIAAGFGGPQLVGAPILSVETLQRTVSVDSSTKVSTESTKVSTDLWTAGPTLHLTPDDVQLTTDVTVEIRSKGIYTVPVYVAKVAVTGQFKSDAMARLLASDADIRTLPSLATLQLPLSSVKYVRSLQRFDVAGSETLHFLPLGGTTSVSARVRWPHPDFEGAFFPISHETSPHGYSAYWQVLELNRAIPQIWRGT